MKHKVFTLMKFMNFFVCAFAIRATKSMTKIMKIYSNVLSRSFIVLDITFMFLIHFELISVFDVIYGPIILCFPGGVIKNPPANAGDISNVGLIPGLGRSPGEANTTLLYSCLENPTDRGTWRATVHRVVHSWT